MNDTFKKLSFAWWNTSLSPQAKSRASDDQKQIAINVIYWLLFKSEVDFLALGEISEDDVAMLQNLNALDDYRIESGVSKSGRVRFDTCFIYRADKMQIYQPIEIDIGKGDRDMKVAQKVILQIADDTFMYLFVSHWQSRLYCPENHPDRHTLGLRLRDAVDEIRIGSESTPYIVLLGDYNDEPFDASLSKQLMATRDKALVIKKKNLLYNPFWKHLSYPNLQSLDYAGTYYYKSGLITKWHTFDQIIVSSAFLSAIEWTLNEDLTGIISIPEYLKWVKDFKSTFDHLPIMTTFERN